MHKQQNNTQGRSAKEHIEDVQCKLKDASYCLNQALISVDEDGNKSRIRNTLDQVEEALNSTNNTLNNLQEK